MKKDILGLFNFWKKKKRMDPIKANTEPISEYKKIKIDLQNKTKTLNGTLEKYWFANKNIGLTKTLFHKTIIYLAWGYIMMHSLPKFVRNPLYTSILATSMLSAGAVQAQMLEEVVVTAQKREESLQDTPISTKSSRSRSKSPDPKTWSGDLSPIMEASSTMK